MASICQWLELVFVLVLATVFYPVVAVRVYAGKKAVRTGAYGQQKTLVAAEMHTLKPTWKPSIDGRLCCLTLPPCAKEIQGPTSQKEKLEQFSVDNDCFAEMWRRVSFGSRKSRDGEFVDVLVLEGGTKGKKFTETGETRATTQRGTMHENSQRIRNVLEITVGAEQSFSGGRTKQEIKTVHEEQHGKRMQQHLEEKEGVRSAHHTVYSVDSHMNKVLFHSRLVYSKMRLPGQVRDVDFAEATATPTMPTPNLYPTVKDFCVASMKKCEATKTPITSGMRVSLCTKGTSQENRDECLHYKPSTTSWKYTYAHDPASTANKYNILLLTNAAAAWKKSPDWIDSHCCPYPADTRNTVIRSGDLVKFYAADMVAEDKKRYLYPLHKSQGWILHDYEQTKAAGAKQIWRITGVGVNPGEQISVGMPVYLDNLWWRSSRMGWRPLREEQMRAAGTFYRDCEHTKSGAKYEGMAQEESTMPISQWYLGLQ